MAGHAQEGSLKEEEVLQQEKVEGQRRKGWTNIAGAALSGCERGRRGQGCTRCREGTTSNGEGGRMRRPRAGAPHAIQTTVRATHATPLRTVCLLASFLACLLGWDGMVWDGLASTIVLW